MRLESYQRIEDGRLKHSGHDYQDIAKTYGTPLYIFDEASFIERAKAYKAAIQSDYFETDILFASKALLTKAIAKLIAALDIGQDVVSAGEIYLGLEAGVDPKRMYFHGNNKLNSELLYAVDEGVGTIVIDNRQEMKRLEEICVKKGVNQRVLLRVNPGVEAHTHEYIKTADNDSKFGESVFDPAIYDIVQALSDSTHLQFAGFHSHIGSQIFDEESFMKAAEEMLAFAAEAQERVGMKVKEINFGGGFGVYYTEGDEPFQVVDFLPKFVERVHEKGIELGVNLEKVTIEPGRSLVNASGSTLYQVGDLKTTVGGKNYLFINGGMNDNIRPALYQAEYEAILTNKADQAPTKTYTIAGKACESGDKIIEAIDLPEAEPTDYLLVNGTGAYNFVMASNYNSIPVPGMIHINGDEIRATVAQQSFEDMYRTHL
ncbi:diaminopimelate decarboxylase [Suicoccus acidiformans]|uniref:Diaminopimelate decarboxylase n=1 Tax=Suicoccus acidiformans TaxID=2036206 RepID=A0A347WKQ0_9LACT|nr:diaminopimelate decarboxylase [Suicoccus acidiformans]AXY25657.1 diaminopimelate decarboxylase [Suicoccus acidiformans]